MIGNLERPPTCIPIHEHQDPHHAGGGESNEAGQFDSVILECVEPHVVQLYIYIYIACVDWGFPNHTLVATGLLTRPGASFPPGLRSKHDLLIEVGHPRPTIHRRTQPKPPDL